MGKRQSVNTPYQLAIKELYNNLPENCKKIVLCVSNHHIRYENDKSYTLVLPCLSTASYMDRVACAKQYQKELVHFVKMYKKLNSLVYMANDNRGAPFNPNDYTYSIHVPPAPYVIYVDFKYKYNEEESPDDIEPSEKELKMIEKEFNYGS